MVALLTMSSEIHVHTWGIYTQQEPCVNMGTSLSSTNHNTINVFHFMIM